MCCSDELSLPAIQRFTSVFRGSATTGTQTEVWNPWGEEDIEESSDDTSDEASLGYSDETGKSDEVDKGVSCAVFQKTAAEEKENENEMLGNKSKGQSKITRHSGRNDVLRLAEHIPDDGKTLTDKTMKWHINGVMKDMKRRQVGQQREGLGKVRAYGPAGPWVTEERMKKLREEHLRREPEVVREAKQKWREEFPLHAALVEEQEARFKEQMQSRKCEERCK